MTENYDEEFHKIRDASILDPFVYDDIKCYCKDCEIQTRDLTRMNPNELSHFIDRLMGELRNERYDEDDDEMEEDDD
jgi:hypothetical protein